MQPDERVLAIDRLLDRAVARVDRMTAHELEQNLDSIFTDEERVEIARILQVAEG